jgi:hypothetical protein
MLTEHATRISAKARLSHCSHSEASVVFLARIPRPEVKEEIMANIPWPFGDAGLEGGGLNRNSRTNLHSPQPDVAETEKEGDNSLLNAREAALTFYRAVVCRHIRIGMLIP